MKRSITRSGLFWVAISVAACSGGTPSNDDSGNQQKKDSKVITADGAPVKKLVFASSETLDTERAGKHAMIAGNGSKVAVAYYREIPPTDQPFVTCPATTLGGGGTKQRPGQFLYYVEYNGGSWAPPKAVVKTSGGLPAATIGEPQGLSILLDRSSNPHIGFLGGAVNQQLCNSSDAMVATSTNSGTTWSTTTVRSVGDNGADTAGHWMAIALDGSGAVQAAYRDVQFDFYEQDGDADADLRLGPSGEVITKDLGDGLYNLLLYTSGGDPVVATYNPIRTGLAGGIRIGVRSGSTWTVKQVFNGTTRERFGFAKNSSGTFGIAYFNGSDQSIRYLETKDPANWPSSASLVDLSTSNHGEFASLAFDSDGNPGISYYRCSKPGSPSSTCVAGDDALMFAYRRGTTWKTMEVDTGGSNFCGRYSALAFLSDGSPVIAYQCVAINVKSEFVNTLKVIKGSWQ